LRQALPLLTLVLGLGCGATTTSDGDPPVDDGPTRTFAMGFTAAPHDFTPPAFEDAWRVVAREGDLAVLHYDDGVPWDEALEGRPYPHEAELRDHAARVPRSHVLYVAVTPLSFLRNGLAPHRLEGGSLPPVAPWNTRALDDPAVVEAYGNHCLNMISRFSPRFFAYGVEVNMLAIQAPQMWPAFVSLSRQVYQRLKQAHPSLSVFLTVQADFIHGDPARQQAAFSQILPYTDVVAVSSYAFSGESDPTRLPADYFTSVAGLGGGKPFAMAETCWPAEDVTAPYPKLIPGSDDAQRAYVERLLGDAERLNAVFVNYFFTRDYDDLWENRNLESDPSASLLRLWKDCGLYTGDGQARPALTSWRTMLVRPRR
jgi:hypothetical protein